MHSMPMIPRDNGDKDAQDIGVSPNFISWVADSKMFEIGNQVLKLDNNCR